MKFKKGQTVFIVSVTVSPTMTIMLPMAVKAEIVDFDDVTKRWVVVEYWDFKRLCPALYHEANLRHPILN